MQKKRFGRKATLMDQKMIIHLGMIGVAIFIFWLLNNYVNSIQEDTEFHKILLSRDIAMLANTIYLAPGNVEYDYSNDKIGMTKFQFEFTGESKTIPLLRVTEGQLEKIYPYAKPTQAPYPERLAGPKSLHFSKINSTITTSKNE